MKNLSLEDIEFIKILAHSDSTILVKTMNENARNRLELQIGTILREYYRENTMDLDKIWTREFESAGITEDEGKAAIACARRLGLNFF